VHAAYLQPADELGWADPLAKVPEMSRRARGVPLWAALRSLGRSGVADLVEGLARNARAIDEALGKIDGAEVLNEVVFTQVLVSFGDDKTTRAVIDAVIADGTTWMSGSRWHDQDVLRVSVSNWSTDADDVTASVDAVLRAVNSVRSERR
jgi:glutamate/tyrosine decarboxylase-like PLP-dependent enzyme